MFWSLRLKHTVVYSYAMNWRLNERLDDYYACERKCMNATRKLFTFNSAQTNVNPIEVSDRKRREMAQEKNNLSFVFAWHVCGLVNMARPADSQQHYVENINFFFSIFAINGGPVYAYVCNAIKYQLN